MLSGEIHGTASKPGSVIDATGKQIGLAKMGGPDRLVCYQSHGSVLLPPTQGGAGPRRRARSGHTHNPGPKRSRGLRTQFAKPGTAAHPVNCDIRTIRALGRSSNFLMASTFSPTVR